MWSYYGAKGFLAKYYPSPKHDVIIEPFAGSARYSLKYYERQVILIDKNKDVIDIWEYLRSSSHDEIMTLPNLPAGTRIERGMFSCDGQYKLMRFMIVQAAYGGNNIVSKWGALRFETNKKRVAENVHKIKHWQFIHDDFTAAQNIEATWFIDPPYRTGGHKYPMSNKKIDYSFLSEWCFRRSGQVIVCENGNADWLPFKPMAKLTGVKKTTTETIWTNHHTFYKNKQLTLI